MAENQTRLALLKQRQFTAIKKVIDSSDEKLKIKMASLDALSPLSVLKRGFFDYGKRKKERFYEMLKQVEVEENVQIRLANGKLKAKVLEIRKN
ncbi:MAG: hypothetical protein HC846_13745 [Blastocatellia bacterium]|nr:hypothetical protein [Blastocatellia bacterium]